MLASMLILLASVSPVQIDKRELELSGEDRHALLTGLRTRVGGKFIITGLKDAQRTCDRVKTCATGDAVLAQAKADPQLRSAASLNYVVRAASVHGERPAAVVSLRGARFADGGLRVYASVYDAEAKRWANKSALLTNLGGGRVDGPDAMVRKLLTWTDVSVSDRAINSSERSSGRRARQDRRWRGILPS